MKRRHIDRLQNAAKRRSTATCSSRDKEMDGVALESVLQNFLTSRNSRRRLGKPSSSNGSPMGGSPKNGSLSEITSQVNLPTVNQKGERSSGAKEVGKKEWTSADELTQNSSRKREQPDNKDDKAEVCIPHEKETKAARKEESQSITQPATRTTSVSSSGRSFSTATDDGEEDLQDNNEEEAQKLREASKKVLRFQNSRSSVSSGEFSLENQKSPGPPAGQRKVLHRQCTFDEETERYPGDPTNDELVKFLLNSPPLLKLNLGRRHTLPPKVLKTDEDKAEPLIRSPNPVVREKEKLPVESAGYNPPKQVFDFTDLPQNFQTSSTQDLSFPSEEKKSKPDVSLTRGLDQESREEKKDGKSVEPTGKHLQRNNENTPPKTAWIKTETTGLFFNFFKRLGDFSKMQTSKDSVDKGAGSE